MKQGAKPKLLIIDDDPRIVQIWTLLLQDAGFDVIGAHSGKEGLHAAYREHPDLVLLDLVMPDMDGFETLQHLRLSTDIPVILLTTASTAPDQLGIENAAADFMPKATHARSLIAHIRKCLCAAAARSPSGPRKAPSFQPDKPSKKRKPD